MRLGSLFAWTGAGVLSVAKLTVGQEAYYEQQVARGLDDYYAGRGESPGLGLERTEPVKGMAELEQVPGAAIRAFSTRRQSLVEHMEALGTEGFAASRVAALATREAKEHVELPRLQQEWRARAAEHGLGRCQLAALVREPPIRRNLVEREQLATDLLGADGLTTRQTTFTMPELVRAVAGSLPRGASVDAVLETAEQLSRFPGVELIEPGEAPGRPARFTTVDCSTSNARRSNSRSPDAMSTHPGPDEKMLMRALLDMRELTNGQQHLIRDASLSPDRVVCVVGVAGAGKTTALRTLADIHRASEMVVLVAAPNGRAADELAAAAGIRSSTLHRLLLDAQQEGGLPHRCLLVIDEAGMAETRILAPLLRLIGPFQTRPERVSASSRRSRRAG